MIYDQNTLPILRIRDTRPTLQQFRERYGLSRYEVAVQARIRVLFVYLMERGGTVEFADALRVMEVLSKYAGYPVQLDEMQGLHLKHSQLQALLLKK